jgi:uncharacterized protein (TIRG00374 family)
MKKKSANIFRNKRIVIALSILLGVAAIIVLYRLIDIKEVIKTFQNTTLTLILMYVIVQMFMLAIITWRWKVVLESQNIKKIKFLRLMKYVTVGIGVSFLTPSGKIGGEPVRAGFISSKENIPLNKAFSSVIIDRAIDITASVLFFVIGMLLMILVFVASPLFTDIILFASIILLGLIILFNYRMLRGKKVFQHVFRFLRLNKIKRLNSFEKKLESVEALVIKFYHKDTKYFYQAIGICLLSWLLMFGEYKIAGLMVGQNLTIAQSFLIFSFVGMAYIMPVPMGLGTLEASQVSAFSIIGLGAAPGLALSFLVRLKDFLIAIIGILVLTIHGISIKKTVNDTKYLDTELSKLEKQTLKKKDVKHK